MPLSTVATPRVELPEALEIASKEVDTKIFSDSKFPSLEEQLGVTGYASLSGLSDQDYPTIDHTGNIHLDKHLTSFKRVPLPDELLELFSHVECNAVMGVFPEVNRAWVSIDSDIYFWRYEDGSDLAYYDGLKEAILAVCLINPRPGVFQDHIKYLLCITTANYITILGVCFSETNTATQNYTDGAIQLIPEPLFTVSSDQVYLTSICGTANGRIFLSGKDNCLYELVYKTHKSWFGKQCYKVNHSTSTMSYLIPSFLSSAFSAFDPICQIAVDNSRGLLYCRTEQGSVKVYNLGESLDGMKFLTVVTSASASKQAQCIARTITSNNFEKIVHVAPVSKSDSSQIHMVAVTDTGVRLYFILTPGNDLYGHPSQLQLAHVRMPPGFAPGLMMDKPTNVRTAFYRKGASFLIAGVARDIDVLWCFSQDMFPFKTPIKESQSLIQIESETWSVTEIPDYTNDASLPYHLFNNEIPDPPAMVTQHILPPRKFVLLSTEGSHIITLARPLEQLKFLLHASRSGESEAIANFFKTYGVEQSCAVCLVLICQTADSELELGDLAVSSFFRYGGETSQSIHPGTWSNPGRGNINSTTYGTPSGAANLSSYIIGSPIQGGSSEGSYLATPAYRGNQYAPTPVPPNLNSSTMSQTQLVQPQTLQQEPALLPGTDNRFSGKYNGLVLYFSRIVRPIWNFPMVYLLNDLTHINQVWSRLSCHELSWFIGELKKLKDFMDRYSGVSLAQSPNYINRNFYMNPVQGGATQEQFAEKKSLQAFHRLIALSIEALELWRILSDHQFHAIVESANQDIKDKLLHIPFKDLFSTTGRELSCSLINLLMAKYLNDHSTVESLSEKLRLVCPTIFSADDAIYAKANEMVMGAAMVSNRTEKSALIQEAILAYGNVANLVDLEWVCNQLKTNKHFEGIVQLGLTIAIKRDPRGVALHYYKSGEPRDDLEGMDMFAYRQECYRYITATLEDLLNSMKTKPMSPSKSGINIQSTDTSFVPEEARKHFESMLHHIINSDDELCHVTIYDWLIQSSQSDRLLQIKSPFVEQYLIAVAAEKHPNNRSLLDLLWKFYEKNGKYMEAARILLKLAEREGAMLIIHDRIEYLSRAVMCAKSCGMLTSGSEEGEVLHEIEEKLEVARIQLMIFEQIVQKKPSSKKDGALSSLNSKLIDISTLYGDFAEEFGLPECKLAIILCANHNDPNLIEKIWMEIVDQVFSNTQHLPSSAHKIEAISQRLIQIGKKYSQHEQYFHINQIIFLLEQKSCENDWDITWVINIVHEIGIQFSNLFQQYDNLFKTKNRVWKNLGRPYHLLNVISILISKYIDDPSNHKSERMIIARSLYEAVTSYLVELETKQLTTNVQTLISTFKGIQGKLKRIL